MTNHKARAAIERTYEDICDIFVLEDYDDGGITRQREVPAFVGLPCALSQKELKATSQTDSQNKVNYSHKLFIAPEPVIRPGCKVAVRRFGREYFFKTAGEPFVYDSHQEVLLNTWGRA